MSTLSSVSSSSSDDNGVQIQSVSMVKPLRATKALDFYLPPADTFFLRLLYIRDVLFYPLIQLKDQPMAANSAWDVVMDTLKHGLAAALVHFYPIAGRLCLRDARLTIDCNDAGVEFVEAMAADRNFCELRDTHFPIHDFYNDLAGFSVHNASASLQDTALLSIQVTRFKDGDGIAIGVAASHVVFDGHSLWYFLNAWGECCRQQGVSLPPLHVRAVLKPQCLFPNSKLPREECPLPVLAVAKHVPQKGHHKVLHFDASVVRQLKHAAVAESGNTCVSSLQAVLACVWKRIITVNDFPPHHKVCMNLKADLRQRLMPALTQAYFGNALETLYVKATAADLMKESIGEIAARISEALRVLDDEAYLRERLAKSKEEEMSQLLSELSQGITHAIFVTHGSKFPVYDVDVGMGPPVAVRPPTIHHDTTIVVYPGKDAGAIDICVRFTSLQTLNAFLSITSPSLDI